MPMNENEYIWLIKAGSGPWRAVSKQEWVRTERNAGFVNTLGQPNEPGTGGFDGNGYNGSYVSIKHFRSRNYQHDTQQHEVILAELAARGITPAA